MDLAITLGRDTQDWFWYDLPVLENWGADGTMQPNDELLRRLKNREAGAQLALKQELFERVHQVCRHMLPDETSASQVAEDLWHDFLDTHVDKVQHGRAIASYLRMTTVRHCSRLREWQVRHQEFDEQRQHSALPTQEDATIGNIDTARHLTRLADCMKLLNSRPRRFLRLRFFHGMTLESVGKKVGVSKQYAGRIIHQSLSTLKTCLEQTDAQHA